MVKSFLSCTFKCLLCVWLWNLRIAVGMHGLCCLLWLLLISLVAMLNELSNYETVTVQHTWWRINCGVNWTEVLLQSFLWSLHWTWFMVCEFMVCFMLIASVDASLLDFCPWPRINWILCSLICSMWQLFLSVCIVCVYCFNNIHAARSMTFT